MVIIAPFCDRERLSQEEREHLINEENVDSFSDRDIFSLTKQIRNVSENVSIINFQFLPKRVMELCCYFSNIPIYAPGASTANLAKCLNKPYFGGGVIRSQ